jgi:adenine phosphoribosyltransferase
MDRITTLTAAGGPSFQVRYRRWKNHPGPGVDFPDTSPFATDGATMRHVVDALAQGLPSDTEVIGGIDIGGLGFAGALAQRSGTGLLDIRKVGSIRADVIRSIMANYELGDGVAVSRANRIAGRTVTILDDCLMTGGTALAAIDLVRRLGGRCGTALFVFELDGMGGRALLERAGVGVHALGTLSQAESDEPM